MKIKSTPIIYGKTKLPKGTPIYKFRITSELDVVRTVYHISEIDSDIFDWSTYIHLAGPEITIGIWGENLNAYSEAYSCVFLLDDNETLAKEIYKEYLEEQIKKCNSKIEDSTKKIETITHRIKNNEKLKIYYSDRLEQLEELLQEREQL